MSCFLVALRTALFTALSQAAIPAGAEVVTCIKAWPRLLVGESRANSIGASDQETYRHMICWYNA